MAKYNRWEVALAVAYVLRVLVVFIPQHGYIHPDEFFQCSEPIAVHASGWRGLLTWEWTSSQPLRSAFIPLLIVGSIHKMLNFVYSLLWSQSQPSAYLLLVLPRVAFALLSFGADMAIARLHTIMKLPRVRQTLFLHATSYIVFTYLNRTFSNSLEYVLFAILLTLVSSSIGLRKQPNTIAIGVLLALGIWARATFALFSFYPLWVWSLRDRHSSRKWTINAKQALVRLSSLAIPFGITALIHILIDTHFHGKSSALIDAIREMRWDRNALVITPLNFALYNVQPRNVVTHGSSPFYQHLLVHLPLLAFTLGINWLFEILQLSLHLILGKEYPAKQKTTFRRLLLLSGVIPFVALSALPHQELRFLLPLLVPLLTLYGNQLHDSPSRIGSWTFINLLLTIFYGHIHQAGVTKGIFYVDSFARTGITTNAIFSQLFLPPRHLLAQKLTEDFHTSWFDLSTDTFPGQLEHVLKTLPSAKKTFLVAPSVLRRDLSLLFGRFHLPFYLEKSFFPTFNFQHFRLPKTWTLEGIVEAYSTHVWVLNK